MQGNKADQPSGEVRHPDLNEADSGLYLLLGVMLISVAVGMGFGLVWAILLMGVFFVVVAIVKEWADMS